VSRALDVRVADLLDQPYPRQSRADHRLHSTVPGIRRELVSFALPPDDTVRPRSLPELAAAVAEASRLRHQVSLDTLGAELPGLLEELRGLARLTATVTTALGAHAVTMSTIMAANCCASAVHTRSPAIHERRFRRPTHGGATEGRVPSGRRRPDQGRSFG
jgi:hypothetical protein